MPAHARIEVRLRGAMHVEAQRERAADHAIVERAVVRFRREAHRDAQIEVRHRPAEDHAAVHCMRTQRIHERVHAPLARAARVRVELVEPPRDRRNTLPPFGEARIDLEQPAFDVRAQERCGREIAQQIRGEHLLADQLERAVAERREAGRAQARVAVRDVERRATRPVGGAANEETEGCVSRGANPPRDAASSACENHSMRGALSAIVMEGKAASCVRDAVAQEPDKQVVFDPRFRLAAVRG